MTKEEIVEKAERVVTRIEKKQTIKSIIPQLIFAYRVILNRECETFEELKKHRHWNRYAELHMMSPAMKPIKK